MVFGVDRSKSRANKCIFHTIVCSITQTQMIPKWYTEWPWDILQVVWFLGWKVRVRVNSNVAWVWTLECLPVINPLTANCRIYPSQQEYCIRQLPDISSDICLDHTCTWRQEYFVHVYGVYNFFLKFDFDQKKPWRRDYFFMAVKGLIVLLLILLVLL